MYIFFLTIHIALLFGALAIVTEPGPILVITKKLRSDGPITDTLAPLHGLEDAITIIIFGIALAYSLSVQNQTPFAFVDILKGPLLEIILSLLIGGLFGFILVVIIRFLKYEDQEKDIVILVSSLVTFLAEVAIANSGIQIGSFTIHLSRSFCRWPLALFCESVHGSGETRNGTDYDLFGTGLDHLFYCHGCGDRFINRQLVRIDSLRSDHAHFTHLYRYENLGKLSGSWLDQNS